MSANETVQALAVGDLIPTQDNPRQIVEDDAMRSLVASIESIGVLQPVLCRPHPKQSGKYDLRAGHRRLHAARKAGLERVPAIVRDMDNKTAVEVTVTENLNREDLHPLDQGKAIKTLLAVGWDAAEVGSRLGRSPGWVMRRACLCELLPKLADVTKKTDHPFSRLHIGVLEQLARLPEAAQRDIAKEVNPKDDWLPQYLENPGECRDYIQRTWLMDLAKVSWRLEDGELYGKAGSCDDCSKRSKCLPQLWDDVQDQNGKKPGRCLDPGCFKEKSRRAINAKLSVAKAKHPNMVLITTSNHQEAKDEAKYFGKSVLQSYSVQRCKKADKGARPAMVITGSGAGTATWIKQPTWQQPAKKARTQTMKEKREQLDARREAFVIDRLAGILDERLNELARAQEIPRWVSKQMINHLFTLHVSFAGSEPADIPGYGNPWAEVRGFVKRKDWNCQIAALVDVLQIWQSRLTRHDLAKLKRFSEDVTSIAAYLSIDVKALASEAKAKLTEPKAWAVAAKPKTKKKVKG